jgi:glutathione reductase (NADPH)
VVHDARASFVDAHTVRLSTGESFTAKHILVATGGWPFVPDVPGAELGITSNEMFDLESLPRRAAIVGGGYIASEFACILNGFGTQVTQYYRGPQILRGFDDEARGHVVAGMQVAGIDIRTNADVARLDRSTGGVMVTDLTGAQSEVDLVLYATGRRPNVQGLGLEALGVAFGQQGEVIVDEWSQTSVPSIYAVGDVTNRINLTPVAIREGHALADTLFRAHPSKADHALVASAVFTQPELGAVGMTEEQGKARGGVQVYTATFRPMKTLFAGRQDRVLMKLIVDTQTRVVLGCHIVGPEAGEMIQLAAIAVKMGATKEDFDRTVAVHPTMAEELVTMRKPSRVHPVV